MSCEFYNLNKPGRFQMGPLKVDIPSLYKRLPLNKAQKTLPNYVPYFHDLFHSIYKTRMLPLKLRCMLKILFRKIGVDDLWLKHFQKYWILLGGRPLQHPTDFFFLRNFYRICQKPPVENVWKNSEEHLAAWQDSEYLYSLFQSVLKETFSVQFRILKLLRKLIPKFSTCLEFGAGSSPVTSALFEFEYYPKGAQFFISDLPALTFHYANYKFRECSNITPFVLSPQNNFELNTDINFDVIFCLQVFEHLNAPLKTVKIFHRILNPGGVLFFDYVKSDAKGLDTKEGLKEHEDVLSYIAGKFKIEYGEIRKNENIGLTVARKLTD